ncbi:MAG: type II toxin-antitoxin system MqsA family antitoxin [Magnetococcales bacterium]|nr:type II toxin-antitoxin system MqsA family antitoxin [Magnetococcales bacterium]MBF0322569.1 type II toxin-antitoxin system MqsA family antitoxin [Magnetococcales bacterium]
MKCTVCKHGETKSGTVSVTLERKGTTLVFREVPAMVCDNCGEVYHDAAVSAQLMHRAEEAVRA